MRSMRHLAFMSLLAVLSSTTQAQERVGGSPLRIAWELDAPAQGFQAVCGRVINDGPVDAKRVRVRVEGVDERGGVITRRDGDVLGQVSSKGLGRFCITMAAGAADYRVTILNAEWVVAPESP